MSNLDDLNRLTQEKYSKIGEIMAGPLPEDNTDSEFFHLLAGLSAIQSMQINTFKFLVKNEIIPADLGRVLILQAQQLSVDLEKSISAGMTIRAETCDCPPCTARRKARGGKVEAITIPDKKDMN